MHMKRTSIIGFVFVVIFGMSTNVSAKQGIKINIKNFPDPILYEIVDLKFDTNADGRLSQDEMDKVEKIVIDKEKMFFFSNKKYTEDLDCDGLQYFKNLKELTLTVGPGYDIDGNGLGSGKIINLNKILNLKKMEKLTISSDGANDKYEFKKFKNLKFLKIKSTRAKKIILNKNVKLRKLKLIYNGKLNSLDIRKLKDLRNVDCFGCGIRKIKFPKKNRIKFACLTHNSIAKINMKWFNPKTLKRLRVVNKSMKKINVKGFKKLKYLSVYPKTKVKGASKKLEVNYTEAI